MTAEEAIEILNNTAWLGTDNGIKVYPAIRVAVDALKKQVPMKPEGDGYNEPELCPVCGYNLSMHSVNNDMRAKYCPECGQRIGFCKRELMKAYMVEGSDPDRGADIVWAENVSDAKKKAYCCDCCMDDVYINIRVKRLQLLDGMENLVTGGCRPWDIDEIRLILVKYYDWACVEQWNRDDCETCVARNYCHWMEDSNEF